MLYTPKNDPLDSLHVEKLVSFIQHDLPGLKDGKYRLQVSQTLQKEGEAMFNDPLEALYDFAVLGDRFSLSNPINTIYSVFPAVNASGRYDAVLPSVVFTKTSFPWTRSPFNPKAKDRMMSDTETTDKDVPTWLTILLLDEDDVKKYIDSYPKFTLKPRIQTVSDLFPASMIAASSLENNYSYFNHAEGTGRPASDFIDPGQQLTDRIETIDIPVSLFSHLAPSQEDLKYMAHVRKVSLVNKATMPGISDVGESEGSFSIVFGNRLPASNRQAYAYLVSLENMEDFLPASTYSPDIGKMVRLAVLKSWTFYSTGDNAAFVDKMKHLNGAETIQESVNDDLNLLTTLRLPIPENSIPLVKDALSMGYVPLNHHMRSGNEKDGSWKGEKTVSWYRSPLCPYSITTARIHPPLVSADQATLYDPTTGLFDVSYAAAWTLGRQLALQDKAFSTKLYNWKRQLSRKMEAETERNHLTNVFAQVFEQIPEKQTNLLQDSKNSSFIQQTIASLKEKNKSHAPAK